MTRQPIRAGIRSNPDGEPEEPELTTEFREAMARFPTGVTVVAVRDEEEVAAITVSAFASLSLNPPLVVVCLGLNASVLPYLQEIGRFTVNVLGSGSRGAASRFSQQAPDDPMLFEPGEAVLRGAVASLICEVAAVHPGGDHHIVVGRVEHVALGGDEPPLIYHRRGYRELA